MSALLVYIILKTAAAQRGVSAANRALEHYSECFVPVWLSQLLCQAELLFLRGSFIPITEGDHVSRRGFWVVRSTFFN